LSLQESEDANTIMKIPIGTPWAQGRQAHISGPPEGKDSESAAINEVDAEMDKLGEPVTSSRDESSEGLNMPHKEKDGFDGDRVLANAILFVQDAGWWIEAAYAVPEGDIGRIWEIMKVVTCFPLITDAHAEFVLGMDFHICWNFKSKLYIVPPRILLPHLVQSFERAFGCHAQQLAC
jgi:hypothetical protein